MLKFFRCTRTLVALASILLFLPFILSFDVKRVLAEEPDHLDIYGATWHYYSHRSESIPWDFLESYCQQNFGVSVAPTRENLCVEQDGSFRWLTQLSASCDRSCTICPEQIYPNFGCSVVACSSGWWGDLTGCTPSSGNLSISIFNDRDGDGVREVDEDSVSALVRIYQSGVGEVHMFTGTGLDRDFPDGDYKVKIEPNSGWIPTKWSVDHDPATTITTYKACAEGSYCTIADAGYPLNLNYPLRIRSTYITYLTLGVQQVLYTCPIEDFQEAGVGPLVLTDAWQYAPFTPSNSGEVDAISVKAGKSGVALRSITCKVVDNAGVDVSATLSSAPFTNADGAQWRDIDFRSNKFNLTGGTGYKIACRGPSPDESWNRVYWIYLNEPVNGKTFRVYKCLKTHSLTGKLWEDNLIKNCVINSGEAKLGNWIVSIQETGQSAITSSIVGSEGEYTISNIPEGTYNVCVTPSSGTWFLACVREDGNLKIPPDYPSFCTDNINLTADKLINFGVRKRYPINGRVCDDTSKGSQSCSLAPLTSICADQLIGSSPASGVRMCVTGESICANTQVNGSYTLPGLFSGNLYEVCITNKAGFVNYDVTCRNPTGASPNCSTIASLPEGGTTSNFGFTKKPTKAWFQIIGSSDIHANGGVTSLINTSAAYPYLLISPAPNPTANAYGVVSALSGILLNSRPVTPNNNWQVANYTTTKGDPAPISFETSINFNRDKFDTLYATALAFNPQGNLDLGKIYKLPKEEEGPVDVNIPGYKLSGDGSVIVLVDGDVDIKNLKKNPASSANSMIILIATGDIIARDSVDKLDAVLISMDGTITINTKGDKQDVQITINGALYAKNGINLLRNRELADNNLLPTETLTFQPFLLQSSLFPQSLLRSHRTWREVE